MCRLEFHRLRGMGPSRLDVGVNGRVDDGAGTRLGAREKHKLMLFAPAHCTLRALTQRNCVWRTRQCRLVRLGSAATRAARLSLVEDAFGRRGVMDRVDGMDGGDGVDRVDKSGRGEPRLGIGAGLLLEYRVGL